MKWFSWVSGLIAIVTLAAPVNLRVRADALPSANCRQLETWNEDKVYKKGAIVFDSSSKWKCLSPKCWGAGIMANAPHMGYHSCHNKKCGIGTWDSIAYCETGTAP